MSHANVVSPLDWVLVGWAILCMVAALYLIAFGPPSCKKGGGS